MPSLYYQRSFVPGNYYHVYNRGAYKNDIFHDDSDYQVFTDTLRYYLKFPDGLPLSKIPEYPGPHQQKVRNLRLRPCSLIAYCLIPNHFHLFLKQVEVRPTISNLMKRLSITYAMYYQEKYDHSGAVFQGKYKNVLVTSPEQWLYLTKYIHRNPLTEGSVPSVKLEKYTHSSYPIYLKLIENRDNWIESDDILYHFSSTNPHLSYQSFVEDKDTLGPLSKLTLD